MKSIWLTIAEKNGKVIFSYNLGGNLGLDLDVLPDFAKNFIKNKFLKKSLFERAKDLVKGTTKGIYNFVVGRKKVNQVYRNQEEVYKDKKVRETKIKDVVEDTPPTMEDLQNMFWNKNNNWAKVIEIN